MDTAMIIQLVAALLSVLGFALFFNIKKKEIPLLVLAGTATWVIYLLASTAFNDGEFAPTLVASICGAIFSFVLGYRYNSPASIYFFVTVITLVPGKSLYFTMYNAAMGKWDDFVSYGISTLAVVAGIAVGMAAIWAINEFWRVHKQSNLP